MQKILIVIFSVLSFSLAAQQIPDQPQPARLVNDFAHMLSANEAQQLESELSAFARSTSTQIVLITTNDLDGADPAMFAIELGEKWGVGQGEKDNGIVFLIKNKTASAKGEVFIATGYGLEGAIPDAVAKRIVEQEVLPAFRQGNVYGGIVAALRTMKELSLGEYPPQQYLEQTKGNKEGLFGVFTVLIVFFFFIFSLVGRTRRLQSTSFGRELPFWVLLGMLSSGSRSHGGSFGNFSSGGGSFGGFSGGGGFGGFGGGSFGGGGAGGSW